MSRESPKSPRALRDPLLPDADVEAPEGPAATIIIPEDAIIMVDVDGTLLTHEHPDQKNAALCELLRNRHINYLTAMGPVNLSIIYSVSFGPSRPLTRAELRQQMLDEYNIFTEQVIVPADAKYTQTAAGEPRIPGSAYTDFIEPHYPSLMPKLGTDTNISADPDFVHDYQAFQQVEEGPGPECTKGNALRRYLAEHPGNRPVVFFDDSDQYLDDVYNTCTQLGRPVLCYKVDTTNANAPTINPYWKNALINNLQNYITTRDANPHVHKRHWVNLGCFKVGAGYRKNTKILAAQEMIKLLKGQDSVLNKPNHELYQTYLGALSQTNIRGDSALYSAIRDTRGLPAGTQARSTRDTVRNIIQRCPAAAEDTRLKAARPV